MPGKNRQDTGMGVLNNFEKAAAGNGLPPGDVFDGLPCNAYGLLPAIACHCLAACTVLLPVDQTGGVCHAGRRNCSRNEVPGDRVEVITEPVVVTGTLYGK